MENGVQIFDLITFEDISNIFENVNFLNNTKKILEESMENIKILALFQKSLKIFDLFELEAFYFKNISIFCTLNQIKKDEKQIIPLNCFETFIALSEKNKINGSFYVNCPKNCADLKNISIFGNIIYSTDSSICLSAIHSGFSIDLSNITENNSVIKVIPFQTKEIFEGKMQNNIYSSDFFGGENSENKHFQNYNSFYFSIESLKYPKLDILDNFDSFPASESASFLEIQSNLTLNSPKTHSISDDLTLSQDIRNELKNFISVENFLKETLGEIYENYFLATAKEKLKFDLNNILIFIKNLEMEEFFQRNLDRELKLLLENQDDNKLQMENLNNLERFSDVFDKQINEIKKYS